MVSAESQAKALHREIMASTPPGGVAPTQEHILLGRGKSHLNHMGNVWFQKIIEDTVPMYMAEKSIHVKRNITYEIVCRIMREKGGFLRWSKNHCWERIPLEDQRQKVAHALQYRIRAINKEEEHKRDEMLLMKSQSKNFHSSSGPQHTFAVPYGHDVYRQVHNTNDNSTKWMKINAKRSTDPNFRFQANSLQLKAVSDYAYSQHNKPVNHAYSYTPTYVVPMPEKRLVNNPVQSYAQPMQSPLQLPKAQYDPRNALNDLSMGKTESKYLSKIQQHNSSQIEKPAAVPAPAEKPQTITNLDNGKEKQNSSPQDDRKRKAEPKIDYRGSNVSDEEFKFVREPRFSFLAVSSSNQLSAENAIVERSQKYRIR